MQKTQKVMGMCLLWCSLTMAQATSYEVWIVARKPDSPLGFLTSDAGHAFIALVSGDQNGWKAEHTFGFWPGRNFVHSDPSEMANVWNIIEHHPISARGFAVRKSRISKSRFDWIVQNASTFSGCNQYWLVGGVGDRCNCMDFATRTWHVLSAEQDDFRIRFVSIDITLDALVDNINARNQRSRSDFLDGGNTWQ